MAVVSTSFFVGCDSDDDFTPPNYVTFADVTFNSDEMTVSVGSESSESVDLTIFTGNQTGSARTFGINVVESSTLDPSTYSLPETVTIPANSNEATISLDITGSGIDNAGDVLVLQMENEAGLYVGDELTVNIIKVCPFDASQWAGTYEVSEVFTAGGNAGLSLAAAFGESYQVELVENDSNSVIVNNSEGFNKFMNNGTVLTFGACAGNVMLSTSNIADFANLTVTSSSFDEATQTITVTGTLGTYGTYQFVLTPASEDNGDDNGDGTDEDNGDDTDGDNGDA